MFIFAVILFCISQFYAFGRREPLERFVLEEGIKPPIFGSYSYDPINQVFEPLPRENGTNETLKLADGKLSTVLWSTTEIQVTPIGRMQQPVMESPKPTVWWLRPKVPHFKSANVSIKARTF